MSCFWDSILESLNNLNKINENNINNFIRFLKDQNVKTENVYWQDEKLSSKQLDENYEHINNYDISEVYNGYLCSTCDPFLILICEIFCININHDFIGNLIIYKNISDLNLNIVFFGSDSGHFF